MPAVSRVGDVCSGHGCFPPRQSLDGTSTVFVNGISAVLQGTKYQPHSCGNNVHDGELSSGSSTVYMDGKQVGRLGDPVNCGSVVAKGSNNVFAGG